MPIAHVYILRSRKDKKLYVGYTANLRNRLIKHKYGEVIATRNRRPLELVYCEEWESKEIAKKREKYLKSLYGYREKYRLIKNFKGAMRPIAKRFRTPPDKFTK